MEKVKLTSKRETFLVKEAGSCEIMGYKFK